MTRETRETRPTKETRAHTPRPARAVADAIDRRPARTPMALTREKKNESPIRHTFLAVHVDVYKCRRRRQTLHSPLLQRYDRLYH